MKFALRIFAALCLCLGALAQQPTTFQPGVTFTDGAMTALVMGPTLPCPPQFNWPWCSALNTNQYLWFYASTTDAAVISFLVTATYTPADGSADVTVSGTSVVPAAVVPGKVPGLATIVLTLPYPAAIKGATISPVGVKQTSAIVF